MKRLKRAVHVALVWIAVCLMLVDPASACRLLARRRCCNCERPPPSCCTVAEAPQANAAEPAANEPPQAAAVVEQPVIAAEPAPYEAPRAASTGAGRIETATLPIPSSAGELTPSVANDSARSSSAVDPDVANNTEPTPAAIEAPNPSSQSTTEPAISPPAAAAIAPRQPTEIDLSTGTEVSPPLPDASPVESRSLELPTPLPAALQSRHPADSAAPSSRASIEPSGSQPTVVETSPSERPATARSARSAPGVGSPEPGASRFVPKMPARPGIVVPNSPVAEPAFPPTVDDPFAPLPPAVKTIEPREGDPFAPIKTAPAPETRPLAPIAAEPTKMLIDPLLPAADGRLPLREWNDNSGQFHVKARLINILDGKVRLLKETGRTTTVPTDRLGPADLRYVEEIVARYGKDLAKLDQLASR